MALGWASILYMMVVESAAAGLRPLSARRSSKPARRTSRSERLSRPDRRPDILYLAAPYSHADPAVRAWRYEMATAAAARLLSQGTKVFSPLTLTHPLDLALQREGTELDSDYWVAFDEPFMDMCSGIVVLRLDGWESSRGVAHEIEFFLARNRPVYFIDTDGRDAIV